MIVTESKIVRTQLLQHEILAYALRDALIEVPYTSVSQFYEIFENTTPPAHFGVSCVWQSYLLGGQLARSRLFDVRYLYDGRHVAVICATENRRFLLDPYLLHTQPIELQAVPGGQASQESFAYPYRRDADGNYRPSRLVVQESDQEIRLTYTKFSPTRQHHTISRAFQMNWSCEAPQQPPAGDFVKELLYHGEQNNLSIRVVLRDSHELCELIYPIALCHGEPVDVHNLVARNNMGHFFASTTDAYRNLLAQMAESLGCRPGEIEEFVLGGAAIYERYAPPEIRYAPYKIAND